VGVSQSLRRWTEGATYIRQGDHQALAHISSCYYDAFLDSSRLLTVAVSQCAFSGCNQLHSHVSQLTRQRNFTELSSLPSCSRARQQSVTVTVWNRNCKGREEHHRRLWFCRRDTSVKLSRLTAQLRCSLLYILKSPPSAKTIIRWRNMVIKYKLIAVVTRRGSLNNNNECWTWSTGELPCPAL